MVVAESAVKRLVADALAAAADLLAVERLHLAGVVVGDDVGLAVGVSARGALASLVLEDAGRGRGGERGGVGGVDAELLGVLGGVVGAVLASDAGTLAGSGEAGKLVVDRALAGAAVGRGVAGEPLLHPLDLGGLVANDVGAENLHLLVLAVLEDNLAHVNSTLVVGDHATDVVLVSVAGELDHHPAVHLGVEDVTEDLGLVSVVLEVFDVGLDGDVATVLAVDHAARAHGQHHVHHSLHLLLLVHVALGGARILLAALKGDIGGLAGLVVLLLPSDHGVDLEVLVTDDPVVELHEGVFLAVALLDLGHVNSTLVVGKHTTDEVGVDLVGEAVSLELHAH